MPVSYGSIFYCGFIRQKLNDLKFNWTRRRYLWRASLYYNLVSWVLIVGIVLTFLFHYLVTKFNFFVNYSCSSRSIRMISWYIVTLIVMTGMLLMVSIFLGRMCNMFSNYTLSHFMSTGKWLNVFGCTIKWFPWLSAILMCFWFIIQFSGLIWIFVNSRQWCEHRFTEPAVNAVKNCRLLLNGTLPCKIDIGVLKHKEVRECNHPGYLIRRKIMLLALKDINSRCTLEDDVVCRAFRDVLSEKHVSWDVPSLNGCLGILPNKMDEYIDKKIQVIYINIYYSSISHGQVFM